MTNWNDFEDDLDHGSKYFAAIPDGTIAKVKMYIKRGKYNDPKRNWTGGYATRSENTGSVYLDVFYTVLEGEYIGRQVRGMIGLHSKKDDKWARMGRDFVKAIMCSARGVSPFNKSDNAKRLRKVTSFADLDEIVLLVRIDTTLNRHGNEINVINRVIAPDHDSYRALMGDVVVAGHIQNIAKAGSSPTRRS